ncbi:Transient Receptor Potential Cation Channel Subfamily M Member 2 [Manis pentadactyla]|nr:Transient Receptor Potential Cation Channel Subfamily M Member 2 [Manis pentadactyla]
MSCSPLSGVAAQHEGKSFCEAGNDLEALQIHLCILASDFTIEGQLSLEAPLTNITRKLLPQQTKRKGGENL